MVVRIDTVGIMVNRWNISAIDRRDVDGMVMNTMSMRRINITRGSVDEWKTVSIDRRVRDRS